MEKRFDFIVVGAGIVGLTTAYTLSKEHPEKKVIVLEKEADAFLHQSGRNSGVIHSGVYYKPNTLKAINCRKGYDLLLDFAEEHQIPYEITGKLIVATDKSQLAGLETLYDYGKANGLEGIKIINPDEIKKIEPYCTTAIKALHVPQAGIIDYRQVGKKLIELIISKGGKVLYNQQVLKIENVKDKKVEILTNKTVFLANKVVVCGGVHSDQFIETSLKKKVRIFPFKGEYFKLKKEATHLVNGLIYPVPDMNFPFLGVHFTKTIDQGVEAGPNAVLALAREGYQKFNFKTKDFLKIISWKGFWIFALKFWHIGVYETYRSFFKRAFTRSLQKLIPAIQQDQLVKVEPGIRAQALSDKGSLMDDFLIEENKQIVNVINAPSPAATSSFAIAQHIVNFINKNNE